MKSTKKIRKTNDLLCFNSTTVEDLCVENNVDKQQFLSPIIRSASHQYFDENTAVSSLNKENIKKIKKQSILNPINSPMWEKDNNFCSDAINFEFNKSGESSKENKSSAKDKTKKRKIIKAKRLLQNSSQINGKPDKHNVQITYQGKSKHDFGTLLNKNFNSQDSNALAEDTYNLMNVEKSSTFAQLTVQCKREIDRAQGKDLSTEKAQEKSVTILDLTSESLSSTLSPSLSNTENDLISPQLEHLHFKSSKEQLHPSTTGMIESTSRRRTYELEDSVNNISLLKFISANDSCRMNSSADLVQCNTPTEQNYSKITVRKKWDKMKTFSHNDDGPAWSISYTKSPNRKKALTLESQKVLPKEHKTSSSKKNISKVKIPNFSAIHQKALNKVENIAEYKQRKEERAKMLLSGRKPTVITSSCKKKNILSPKEGVTLITKESRKQLRFAPDTSDKTKSPTFIPLPSTPLPKRLMHKTPESAIQPFQFGREKTEYPQFSDVNKDCPNLVKVKSEKQVFTLKSKELHQPKTLLSCHTSTSTKYKLNVIQMKNMKSIITKSQPATNKLESRRCAIKGVRSNRRFELLMNMRKGK